MKMPKETPCIICGKNNPPQTGKDGVTVYFSTCDGDCFDAFINMQLKSREEYLKLEKTNETH